jgi:DNA (cytosine-5)-methyltransferase 1
MGKGITVLELCAGAGGQALGFEQAGFDHVGLVEIDHHACKTLRHNRPRWKVLEEDLRLFDPTPFIGKCDVIAAGLPCPPFSKAGKQLGELDERNLFPAALRIIKAIQPRAVVIENVRGILDAVFEDYRSFIEGQLEGYWTDWKLLNASDYGVPQLRLRVNFVAIRKGLEHGFSWPEPTCEKAPTVGEALYPMMAARNWKGVQEWKEQASEIAPTLVGGSKKHGGPDLGPTRAKRAWASLGVDGLGLANHAPDADFVGMPKLTVPMAARIQGFPEEWEFAGGKTAAYRQVGNAFPPPVAAAVAGRIKSCLEAKAKLQIAG